jgi:hypothetical protein
MAPLAPLKSALVKMTVRASSTAVIEAIETFWAKARIPIRPKQHCIIKVEQLFNKWAGLKKNSKRDTDKQRENEAEFAQDLDNLFDIAHADALDLIKIQEDKEFLIAQRQPGRQGCIGSVDRTLTLKEARAAKRKVAAMSYKQRAEKEEKLLSESVVLSSSTEDSSAEMSDHERPSLESSAVVSAHSCKKDLRQIL